MIKDVMRDNMDESIVMQKGREIKEKIKERVNNDVLTFMKTRDPDFDLVEFELEIKEIFEEVYRSFLKHDLGLIEQVCLGEALGHFKAVIES